MKKYAILVLVLALCAVLFTGCRSRNDVNNTTRPDTGVTTTPTAVTTRPTTQPTTQTTTETTVPTTETMPEGSTNGTDITPDVTDATGGMEGRGRGIMPRKR